MHDFEIMDTLPGTEQPRKTGERPARILRQPIRLRVTDPITVLPAMFARSTVALAVVVDAENKPLGTIHPVALLRSVDQHGRNSLAGMSVRSLTEPAVALPEHSSLLEALQIFSTRSLAHALVVDAQGQLVGMLTADDLLHVASSLSSLSIGGLLGRN